MSILISNLILRKPLIVSKSSSSPFSVLTRERKIKDFVNIFNYMYEQLNHYFVWNLTMKCSVSNFTSRLSLFTPFT